MIGTTQCLALCYTVAKVEPLKKRTHLLSKWQMRSVIFIEFAAIIGMYSAPNLLRPQSGPGLILVLPSRCIQQVQRGELSKQSGIVLTIKYSKKILIFNTERDNKYKEKEMKSYSEKNHRHNGHNSRWRYGESSRIFPAKRTHCVTLVNPAEYTANHR